MEPEETPSGTGERMAEPEAGTSGTRALARAADLVATVVRADEPLAFADLQESSGLAKSTASLASTGQGETRFEVRFPAGR